MTGSFKPLLIIVLSSTLALPCLLSFPLQAQRREWWVPIQEAISKMNPFRQNPQPPKPIAVSPGDRRSGGPRDLCPITSYPLTSFVLPTTDSRLTYIEPVISSHPTFWFYVPYTATMPNNTSRRLEFVLLGSDERIIYEQRFLLPKTAGVVSVSIPQTLTALQVGQRYRWVVSVICNPLNRSGDATVNGWIERVNLSTEINNRLIQAIDLTDKTVLYAEQQLWYEIVSTIANPIQPVSVSQSDLQSVKNALLKEVELPENTPFLGSAVPEPPKTSHSGH